MPTKAKPVYSLSADARREAAERFTGLVCVIEVRPFRDNDNRHNRTYTGQVLGVAVPNTGTIADQLIVKLSDSRQYLQALSLATVYSIEVA